MNQRLQLILSSIGKKELMALTGLGFVGFLVTHLAGNLTIIKGGAALDGYAEKLESLGPLVIAAELGLLAMLLLHVIFGVSVVLRNWQARGQRYEVKRVEGGRTLGSYTMWFTGPWILIFLGLHLWHFAIPHKLIAGGPPLSAMLADWLSNPWWAAYYVASVIVVGLHVSHGFWSAFQTLGAAGRKGLRDAAMLLGMAFGLGYGLRAFFVFYIPNLLK